jgi:ABC-2 type transport system permease protein
MRQELRAEWTKLTTLRSTAWLLLAAVAVTIGGSAAATGSCTSASCGRVGLSLMGVQAGQAVVALLAVLTVSNEYGTGMIHTTFTAMPRRTTVFTAKATVVTALTLAAALVAVPTALLVGRLILPGHDPALRAISGAILYLALIALISLGIATAIRDTAVSIGVVYAILYVLPTLSFMVSRPSWQRFLWRICPLNAGLAVQSNTKLPLSPSAGVGVLLLWTTAALLTATLLLKTRDA